MISTISRFFTHFDRKIRKKRKLSGAVREVLTWRFNLASMWVVRGTIKGTALASITACAVLGPCFAISARSDSHSHSCNFSIQFFSILTCAS